MRCKDIGNGPRADNCQKAVKTAKSGSNSGIPYSTQSIKSIGHLGHINDTCTKTLQSCFLQVFKVDQIQDRKQSESDVLNYKDSRLEFDALLEYVENNVGGLPYKSL